MNKTLNSVDFEKLLIYYHLHRSQSYRTIAWMVGWHKPTRTVIWLVNLLICSTCHFFSFFSDMTMLHTKFIAPLPPNMHEFMCSLKMVFSNVVDISHLWRQIGPLRKAKNTQAALSYLQRHYCVPIEIEIPQQGIIPANIIHTSCFLVNHALRSPSYFTK